MALQTRTIAGPGRARQRRALPWLAPTTAALALAVPAAATAGTTSAAASAPGAVPSAVPVLAYGFGTVTGGRVSDSSGHRFDGLLQPAAAPPVLTAGPAGHGTALGLVGAKRQFVLVGSHPPLDVDHFTIAAWVRYRPLVHDENWEVMEKGAAYWLNVRTDTRRARVGGFFGGCTNSPTTPVWKYVDSATPVPAGRWVHLAGTYDGATLRVFVNGRLSAILPAHGRTCVNTNPLAVGAKHVAVGTLNYFDGGLDDVRVYGTALSGAAIRELMRRPV